MPRRVDTLAPDFAALDHTEPRRTRSTAPLDAVDRLRFPLFLTMPGHQWRTWASDDTGAVEALGLWAPDGSIARVHTDGRVHQAGLRRLWDLVEELHQQFLDAVPPRDAFGATVTPDRQWVWLGDPQGPGWELTATRMGKG